MDLSTFEGSDEVTYTLAEQPVTFARTTRDISYDQSTQTLKATKTADLGQGLNTTISVTVKNLRLEIKDNRQTGDYRCVLKGDASMWLQVGVKMGAESITRENGIPKECFDLAGHMFAEVGYTGEIRGVKKFEKPLLPIFTEDNSPIRVHYHIEDSVQVYACTHDSAPAYYTPPTSGNFNPPVGSGIYDKTRLYYYELDDYDQAYITAYCGESTTPVIPDTVDGYPVVGIDDYVFWGTY